MGKWSFLKDKGVAKFQAEPSWQEKVDALKPDLTVAHQTKVALAQTYVQRKRLKDEHEEAVKGLNTELEALSQLLVQTLEDEGVAKISLPDGTTVSVKDEVYVSTQDRAAFYQWVRETGQTDLFTVNYQTVAALVKARIEEEGNLTPPPGIALFVKTSATTRAPRVSKEATP